MPGESPLPTYHGPDPHGSPLAMALHERLDGEVRADDYTRHLYATDASLYRVLPVVVVFPAHRSDVVATVEICAARDTPVLPRGGGTSLAGQTVNEAVVLDFTRHMDAVIDINPAAKTATVQPGVVLDDLNRQLDGTGTRFAPDPASGARSTVGGAIGNNSAGAHSPTYGPTDAHLEEVEVVLADGTVARFGPTHPDDIAERAGAGGLVGAIYTIIDRLRTDETAVIDEAFPDIGRNVAGYALDTVLQPEDDGRINLARLLAGSEGTLGVITEATVRLVDEPAHVGAVLFSYEAFTDAIDDVEAIMDTEPAAVETMDDHLLDKARAHPGFSADAELVPETAGGALLVELFGESAPELETELTTLVERFGPTAGAAIDVRSTTDDDERARYWALRKSALPLMLSETTDEKHASFVEDAAVPPERLPSFVAGLRSLLADHGTYAGFYGHAGAGVLHVRPLVDVTSIEGRETMRSIAEGALELTIAHGGTISGEHGDGRVRTEWTQRQYGPAVVELFKAVKAAFDPSNIMNPGPITGEIRMETDHRIEPDQPVQLEFDPALAWENPNGLLGMVDLCHGCGGCRTDQATGGVMCPTYRASDEEIASTRGRANLLREAIRGRLPPEMLFDSRFEAEVLDLCIGCKGCLHDCPSGVDLATLKVELRHQRQRRRGPSRRERLLGGFPRLARWGTLTAPVSNWLAGAPGIPSMIAEMFDLHPQRSPPQFASTAFTEWADGRLSAVHTTETDRQVVVVPDPYTNYLEPDVGRSTVHLLEAAGATVVVRDDLPPPGRAAYSQGFVERARSHARGMVESLTPLVEDGWEVVVPEPSAAAMLQSDYAKLLGSASAGELAAATYTPLGYLDHTGAILNVDPPSTQFAVHDHCHQESLGRGGRIASVLADHGYAVEAIDSGCCGMAGSFGYHREHYGLSLAIADILLDQLDAADTDAVLASGTSCRSQLEHVAPSLGVVHPVEQLAADLVE